MKKVMKFGFEVRLTAQSHSSIEARRSRDGSYQVVNVECESTQDVEFNKHLEIREEDFPDVTIGCKSTIKNIKAVLGKFFSTLLVNTLTCLLLRPITFYQFINMNHQSTIRSGFARYYKNKASCFAIRISGRIPT